MRKTTQSIKRRREAIDLCFYFVMSLGESWDPGSARWKAYFLMNANFLWPELNYLMEKSVEVCH